ncbi:hypothetical protein ACFWNN_12355 [Lentzea sp. NPDC058450]|uniref:hypothetical protein n=1 Tax=Lentzea sp. NPDC058450 TaxID=3346505 RepID=UPI00365F7D82
MLRDAFADSDISWGNCRHAERPDGVLVVVPPSVSTATIVDRLISRITDGLRRYNREAAPLRVQLRAALHVGIVVAGPDGLSGPAITTAAQLLASPELTTLLCRTDTDIAVIVSSQVFETVIRHASGFADPTRYQAIAVRAEDSGAAAWVCAAETRTYSAPPWYSAG